MRVSDDTLVYNGLDCIATLRCADAFHAEIDQHGFRSTYDHTIDLYRPLMYMQGRGIRVDQTKLREKQIELEKRMVETQELITKACGRFLNPLSPKDCQKYFYLEKGITPYTKRGQNGESVITCDDKALTRIARGTSARRGLAEARLIQRYRGDAKLKGTYLDIRFDADNRIRCVYNPRGTRFGRLSSAETIFETGTNMQNLPEEFKTFLVADPGCLFIELDKRQAEWVVVAYDSGDEAMIKVVEDGKDTHTFTAYRMFGIPEEIIKMEHKAVGIANDPDIIKEIRDGISELRPYLGKWMPRTMSMRQCGKKSNHGLNYDETYKMFSLINEITEGEAKVIVNFYHRTYPGIKSWYKRVQGQLSSGRTLVNCFGRKCRFLDRWGPDLFKAAYSYNPQSTVGELVNRSIIETYDSPERSLTDFELLAQVHDSVLYQSPVSDSDGKPSFRTIAEGIFSIRRIMEPKLACHGRSFGIATDLKVGLSWGEMQEVRIGDSIDDLAARLEKAYNDLKEAERLAVGVS